MTNKPVSDVILPDHDPEYAGGSAYWKRIGANIVSTKLTEQTLEKDWAKAGDFTRKYFPTYPSLPLVPPTRTYGADFTLENGNIRGFYLGPSHNADDIFVYFPKQKVLYAGSILKEHLGNLAFANLEEYPKTLEKLRQLHLEIDKIISGHWSAVHGPELIEQYLAMLKASFRSRSVDFDEEDNLTNHWSEPITLFSLSPKWTADLKVPGSLILWLVRRHE